MRYMMHVGHAGALHYLPCLRDVNALQADPSSAHLPTPHSSDSASERLEHNTRCALLAIKLQCSAYQVQCHVSCVSRAEWE